MFIGMLAMRLVAQALVLLMSKYPFLETAAAVVIGVLGLKLGLSLVEHLLPTHPFSRFLGSEVADMGLTSLTAAIFAGSLLASGVRQRVA